MKGDNKAFLRVDGAPLFIHVLRAMDDVLKIRRIFIVGEKTRLDSAIAESGVFKKPIVTIQQYENLAANIWNTFIATLDGYTPGAEKTNPDFAGRMLFFVPGDSPLITAGEINEFLDKADADNFDYVAGLTPESALAQYLPKEGKPGIHMTCFNVREGRFRINNMHLGRPFAFQNKKAILQMYNSRYQKNLRNIIHFLRDLWAIPKIRSKIWIYLVMQVAMMLSLAGLDRLGRWVSSFATTQDVFGGVGDILGLRAGCVITDHGGSALDVDNDADYETMLTMFAEWKAAAMKEETES